MARDRIIIAFECKEELDKFSFDSDFYEMVKNLAGDIPVLHLDSFSDSSLLNFAKQAVEKQQDVLLLVENSDSQNIKGLTALLTVAARSEHIMILSSRVHAMLQKLKNASAEDDIKGAIQKWISNPSPSF